MCEGKEQREKLFEPYWYCRFGKKLDDLEDDEMESKAWI